MIEDKPTEDLERNKTKHLRWAIAFVGIVMITGALLGAFKKFGEHTLEQTGQQ